MSIIDTDAQLAAVHPTDWKLTRERMREVENFLAGHRTPGDLRETAKALQLSVSRVRRLARSYELHKDARVLAGVRRGMARGTTDDRRAFVRSAIERAIDALGTLASTQNVHRMVEGECTAESLQAPTIQQTWKALAAARRANRAPATGIQPCIAIGRMWFNLPVRARSDEVPRRPEAVIAMELPSKLIRACVTDIELRRVPLAWDAIDLLKGPLPIRATSIELGPEPARRGRIGIVVDDGAQADVVRCLGSGIGTLRVLFRRPRSPAVSLLADGSEALSRDDAVEAVALALARHEEEVREAALGPF